MKFSNEQILEKIYNSGILAEMEASEEYKKLQHEYNVLFDSIEDLELREKFVKLEELKNKMNGQNDFDIFKLGYAVATKSLIEALNTKT